MYQTGDKQFAIKRNTERGFTLIELLIVVSLIIITVGVSSDIVASLVRSYNKTQITNEIEQNANFVLAKMEKELKKASQVDGVSSNQITFTVEEGGSPTQVTYNIASGYITRTVGSNTLRLTDSDRVVVDNTSSSFTRIGSPPPDVIRIYLKFNQSGSAAAKAFIGDVEVETTVVLRGSY